ncbi:alpha/beta hydrolase [Verrucomicrobiota bacterium sgz303538]
MRRPLRCSLLLWIALALCTSASALDPSASSAAVAALREWLGAPAKDRPPIGEASFALVALTKEDAETATKLLCDDHVKWIRETREAEMLNKTIELEGLKMVFETVHFPSSGTTAPPGGRSLFLSLHGGGGAPKAVNDSQWRNQLRLAKAYCPKEGIYLAPRAPTDSWNLWHQDHIDRFLQRLIENLIVLEDVNPNRIYILGYSAGGDGVFQLGPRMADCWAAASMMAGHPNDASPLNLRNIGFSIHVGANDRAYRRNEVAAEWGKRLDELQQADPKGYPHVVEVHEGKGHWMDLEDAKAIAWMEQFTRNPLPEKVVWRQDDVTHASFYWLAAPDRGARAGATIIAERAGQTITLSTEGSDQVSVQLNDAMLDMDKPVIIVQDGIEVFRGSVERTVSCLASTLRERGDPKLIFSAKVQLSPSKSSAPIQHGASLKN